MAVYTRLMRHGIRKPVPAHALTDGAEEARLSLRRLGYESRLRRRLSAVVTQHGTPKAQHYDGALVPAAAMSLEHLALVAGFEARTRETATGCVVEGLHASRRVGFRAYWSRGLSRGATWHSGGRDHWSLVDITDRPIGVDANAKTTKAKHRHDEQDRTRLVLVASPRGVHINVTELRKRIKG